MCRVLYVCALCYLPRRDAEAVLAVQDAGSISARSKGAGGGRGGGLSAVKLSYPHTATDVLEAKRIIQAGGHVFMGHNNTHLCIAATPHLTTERNNLNNPNNSDSPIDSYIFQKYMTKIQFQFQLSPHDHMK